MSDTFDTLLLLALPASGKSEVRTFLGARDPAAFHMGPTIQLDDYPYVHLQLVDDEVLEDLGQPRAYHRQGEQERNGPFLDGRELGALGRLLAEDYAEVLAGKAESPDRAAQRLFERFDAASVAAGTRPKFDSLPREIFEELERALEAEAKKVFDDKLAHIPATREGKTIVIEFARGTPEGATMPATGGYGYAGTLSHLGAAILERSAILYVWVSPEESRRKNRARARPGEHGSILFHGVPEDVMRLEYGDCDMAYLIEQSKVPGTVTVKSEGRTFQVPVARFDNRKDLTTFLRADPDDWAQADVDAIYGRMKSACDALWGSWTNR